MKSIEINHVGPIEHLSIPVPEGGGLVVLRGRNGTGKSHALTAVEALYNQEARKSLRASDRVPSGSISGLGVTVKLSRSNTARGELECESLDSKVDISKLIDPGIKDPISADSRRLETIVHLAHVAVTDDQWRKSLEPEIDSPQGQNLQLSTIVTDDPVKTADRIRRACHDIALKMEKGAETMAAEARALRHSIAHLTIPDQIQSTTELTELLSIATRNRIALEQKREAGLKIEAEVNAAQEKFSKVTDLTGDIAATQEIIDTETTELGSVEEQIRQLTGRRDSLKLSIDARRDTLANLKAKAAEFDKVRQIVQQSIPVYPSQDEIELAQEAVRLTAEALSQSRVFAEAVNTKAKAEQYESQAADNEAIATRWRELARSTDRVLEDALVAAGFTDIKVHDSRLCVESDRGLEPFSELSHGERTRKAFELAARGLTNEAKQQAVFVFGQEMYESLDPVNKLEIKALAEELGILVFTAEATAGDIRSETV